MQENQSTQKIGRYSLARQKMMEREVTKLQVDVGILKTQVVNISNLCDKMDKVIERLMNNQEKIVNDIYDDMTEEKRDTTEDIKELHSRITTVDRNLTEKLESVEDKIMAEIKVLRKDISEHNKSEDSKIDQILEWKWMAAGGILVLTWLLSHIKFDIITKLLN